MIFVGRKATQAREVLTSGSRGLPRPRQKVK
jgi:hypothetical protein